jgi:6-phosphogluconolactonase
MLLASTLLTQAADYLMYVGTYTGPHSKGIYAYRFQPATGEVTDIGLVAEVKNPTFLAIHPSGDYLYSADENRAGTVSAFRIDRKTGKLTPLNSVSSHGSGPCALAVDHTGKSVLVANYNSGSVALLPIRGDGGLAEASIVDQHEGKSVNAQRQQGPHAHSAVFAPGNKFALSNDLGLDKIFVYRFDPQKETLEPNDPAFGTVPPGSGPRHISFHPNGKFAYVVNELNSTVTAFAWSGSAGTLRELGTVSAVAKDFTGKTDGAEIQVSPNGKFVYSSNRGEASNIALFRVDAVKGTLTFVSTTPSGGKEPRYFGFDPTGEWLLAANQSSNDIALFRMDANTGALTASGKKVELSQPVCVVFVAAK